MFDVQNQDPVKSYSYSLPKSKYEALRRIAASKRQLSASGLVDEALDEWLTREFGPQWENPEVLDSQLPLWKQRRKEYSY